VRLDEVRHRHVIVTINNCRSLLAKVRRRVRRLTGWRIDIRSENESNEEKSSRGFGPRRCRRRRKGDCRDGEAGESDVIVDTVIESADEVVEVIEVIEAR